MAIMDSGADSDADLLQQYAAGDAAAFEVLYRRHELKTWRFIRRQIGNDALADELLQEVWFAVAREATRYRPTARFTTWLFTLARNRVIDSLRTRHTHQSLDAAHADGESWVESLSDGNAGPEPQLLSDEALRMLLGAVERLPMEQREAFLLQIEAGLALEEIAALTGASFETVKSRLRYARSRLKRELSEYA
jgi:RNA polymerase sigma-70 factor (ECF subfamily)